MCGGFVTVASQGPNHIIRQCSYHLGRLLTYLIAGAIAGGVGVILNKAGIFVGLSHAAAVITGAMLLLCGILMLAGSRLGFSKLLPLRQINSLHRRITLKNGESKYLPFSIGFFSTLLPCGWLYSYVLVAAATGSAQAAMLTMFFFWLGTLPMLITIGSLTNLIGTPLRKFAPVVIPVCMILAGAASIAGHFGYGPFSMSMMGEHCEMDHDMGHEMEAGHSMHDGGAEHSMHHGSSTP